MFLRKQNTESEEYIMALVSCEKDYGLKPGDELIQCKGFTFNKTISNMGPRKPKSVTVIKEYPRFILVEAYFGDFYNDQYGKKIPHKYREAVNKYSILIGDVYFKVFNKENYR